MAKNVLQSTILSANGGVSVAPGAQIEIRNPSGQLVPLWLDRDGTQPTTNPFYADSAGFFRVYLDAGRYHITASKDGRTQTWENILLGSAAGYDVGSGPDQIPASDMFGSAAWVDVGPDPDQIPTNSLLGGAAGLPSPVVPNTFLRANSAGTGYDALTLSQMYDAIGWQIGEYRHGSDDPNDPPPPKTHWVRCVAGQSGAGQYNEGKLRSENVSGTAPLIYATAVIDDPESPKYEQTIRLVETERRFLRAEAPGTLGDDSVQDHAHATPLVGGTEIPANWQWGLYPSAIKGAAGATWTTGKGAYTSPITNTAADTARTGNETTPRWLGVPVYRRIK